MDRFDSTGNLFQSNSVVLFYPVNSSCFRLFGLAITLRNLETVKCGMLKSNWVRLKNRSLFTDVVLFFFSFFSKTSASARASARTSAESGERRASNFVFPHPYPLALAVNKSSAVFCFLSRALDGLRRENRGSVNRLEKSLLWLHNMNIYIMIAAPISNRSPVWSSPRNFINWAASFSSQALQFSKETEAKCSYN